MYKGPTRKFKRRQQKISKYGTQLIEKQKLRKVYGIREKTLKRYFLLARKRKTDTDTGLIKELEGRLDNVIYRLGWAQTRAQGAQIINHGHIRVNRKRVTIPSYRVVKGEVIEIKENKKQLHIFRNLDTKLTKHNLPVWLSFSTEDKLKAEIIGDATKEDFTEPINLSLVLEFYSR